MCLFFSSDLRWKLGQFYFNYPIEEIWIELHFTLDGWGMSQRRKLAKSPEMTSEQKNAKNGLKIRPSTWCRPWGNTVTSCLHLVCKGKGRVPVYAIHHLASLQRDESQAMVSIDLYIQAEPNPDYCDSHLLQNKALNGLWAFNGMAHPTSSHYRIMRTGWTYTEILGTACCWPDTTQVNAASLSNPFQILQRHKWRWLDAAAGRTSAWGWLAWL